MTDHVDGGVGRLDLRYNQEYSPLFQLPENWSEFPANGPQRPNEEWLLQGRNSLALSL